MARRESRGQTGGVLLRDVARGDLPVLFEHQEDPAAIRMAGVPPRDRDAFEAHWARMLTDRAFTNKAVLFEGRVAGHVMSFERGGHREIGYWIGREHWGRGVATEALSQFLARAETRRPLRAKVARHNAGSVRVLKRCGFVIVGEGDGAYDLRLRAG